MRRRRKCGRLDGKGEELEGKGGREKGKEGSRDREKKEGRKRHIKEELIDLERTDGWEGERE